MDYSAIEEKWQQKWKEAGIWKSKAEPGKPKFFMHFAYPGVSGYLHVGHMRGYAYTDIICRYKKMTGYNVFFPVGVHASGNQAISFAKKVQRGDKKWIEYLLAHGFPEQELKKMKDVNYVIDYFIKEYVNYWQKFGFLADWDSLTCTTYPDYNKFIEWQFKKLNQRGLLVQKEYYATFCPNCGPVAVDPSETDISKGGNAEKYEFTLIKFKYDDSYLVAATLRPETMYGQTNLWVNPEVEYVKVKVKTSKGEETWICSKECAEKLKNQKEEVKVIGTIEGKELIGKKAFAPVVERELIILPSKFCDPGIGTGIVTSVPSDAPYDYRALKDLQENEEECRKYGLDWEEIKSIEIIPIIKSKEWGETPAVKICKEMGIKNQDDPKLEEATKIIYKAGFHTGVMNDNCGPYAGMKVEEAKEKMKQKLIEEGKADVMYDLSEEVICRCGEKVLIKKVPDQWFIKYSDPEWKEKTKQHAKSMKIMPKEYYENFSKVIDWYQDRACARLGNWLGTKLPFDKKWTIEPISDSTLYSAYYVVSRYYNAGKIKLDEMNEEFFDYVFLGKGQPKNEVWEEIRKEFEYWYPVDFNLGGKEHKTVHFPVYVMNHVAILNEKDWPKGIIAHWYVTGKGGKISKSKGGASASPLEAAKKYSVDALRLYYSHAASLFVDVEWNEKDVLSYKTHLNSFTQLIEKLSSLETNDQNSSIDEWIISKMNEKLKEYHKAMEEIDLRKAVGVMLFDFTKDIQRYLKRGGENKQVIKTIIDTLLKTMAPFIPHTCEELWEKTGHESLVSTQQIPTPDESKISKKAELKEQLVEEVEKGINNVIKLTGIKPKKITIITAPEWKRKAYEKAKTLNVKEIIPTLMKDDEIKEHGKNALKYLQWLTKHYHELDEKLSSKEEEKVLKDAEQYLKKQFDAEIIIEKAEDSKHEKANNALPGKPAILLE